MPKQQTQPQQQYPQTQPQQQYPQTQPDINDFNTMQNLFQTNSIGLGPQVNAPRKEDPFSVLDSISSSSSPSPQMFQTYNAPRQAGNFDMGSFGTMQQGSLNGGLGGEISFAKKKEETSEDLI